MKEREQRNGRSVRNQLFASIPVRTRIVKIKIRIQNGEEKRAIEMRVLIKAK